MNNSKIWMRGAIAAAAMMAGSAVQAVEWGPVTSTPPNPYYVTVGNTGYGAVTSYAHNILTSGQETSLSTFLASNPLDQSGLLSLYFADDEGDYSNSNLEYFQYSLNGGAWIGGLTSAYEVDGSVCYGGGLNTPGCKAGYWKFDINFDAAGLNSLLAAPGVPTISLRVNPDYEYLDGYTTTYSYTLATYSGGQWRCPSGADLVYKDGKKQCKVTTKVPKYKDYAQDFYFKGSILKAFGNPKPPEVPEPATLGLLGLGMLGVGLARRRSKA